MGTKDWFTPRYIYRGEPKQGVTWQAWAGIVTLFIVALLALVLGSGCAGLLDALRTPEGQAAVSQAGKGVVGVVSNPVNPWAWYELLVGGVGLATLAFGGKKVYDKRKRKLAPPVTT